MASTSEEPQQILKLPDNVINLIAAGEVIQRPANAVKELIENSLDAGATNIRVTIKNGGIKYLQIQDNGSGIRLSDLELLCHRYTTSKLRQFDDLKSILTFGFRGEALASISQVSHLTILTKTASSSVGYRAVYEGDRLKEKPKPCACNSGTQITAEDFFYNMTDRRQALKSAPEEMKKIADIVSKYAIHNSRVAFTLKKHGETMLDLRTPGDTRHAAADSCPTRRTIGIVYGSPVARELLRFRCDDAFATLAFTAEGYVTNPTYSAKKFHFILFINNRLVECHALKKAMEMLYLNYGPAKSVAPFIYMKINIAPENVDVNVHPTKQVVQFLHEREIIETLEQAVKKALNACNVSKMFVVKNFPSGDLLNQSIGSQDNTSAEDLTRRKGDDKDTGSQKKVEPHNIIRNDGRGRKLDEFFASQGSPVSQKIRMTFVDIEAKTSETVNNSVERIEATEVDASSHRKKTRKSDSAVKPAHVTDEEIDIIYENDTRKQSWRPIRLSSVLELQKAVQGRSSPILRSLLANHTLVGCLDPEYALIQYETGLYLVNTTALSQEFFYQLLLFQFGNFGALRLSEKCPVIDLISWSLPASMVDKRQQAQEYCALLMSKADMLWDYFSLQLVDGYLVSIPWLFEKYMPQFEGLSSYIYRLATEVDWNSEKGCFETVCRETSRFYAFKKAYCNGNHASRFAPATKLDWKTMLESVLYPAMKSKLLPPETFDDSKTIMKLTDVHDLFRVFERC